MNNECFRDECVNVSSLYLELHRNFIFATEDKAD